MITDKIKNVFKFVEFLNSNAENFKSYIPVVENCLSVTKEMSKLKPNDNFKDKIKYNELNEIKNNEFDKVYKNVTKTITGKALELNICHLNNSSYEFNWGLQEIQTLKDNAVENDLPVILKAEKKYLEYRKNVDCDFLSLTFFFSRLDEDLKELFTFFNPTTKSEFKAFETVQVNELDTMVERFQNGNKNVAIPLDALTFLDGNKKNVEALTNQPLTKQKPELPGKLIIFKNSETVEKIHTELKGYFPNKEGELLKALQGEQLTEILLFPHNQNKFVEVFRRLKYNGFLLNTDTETKNWICSTFQFMKKGFIEPQPFNESSVWDNLNKGKGEPTKKERICITDWLPYKSPLQLTRETENEKL